MKIKVRTGPMKEETKEAKGENGRIKSSVMICHTKDPVSLRRSLLRISQTEPPMAVHINVLPIPGILECIPGSIAQERDADRLGIGALVTVDQGAARPEPAAV